MKSISAAAAALAAVGLASLVTPAEAQNASPQLLTVSCSGCHGPNGHSPGAIPSIYGRAAPAIAEALRDFRDGKRPSTVMVRFAKGYTDAEIEAVAAEIAANWK
jgi:cytochrome subunit of sulfide dehydrogenase